MNAIKNCSWCGALIIGEPVAPGRGYYAEFNGHLECIVSYEVAFCSGGCAWRWGIESHKLVGVIGKAARQHLIDRHGLTAGVPAGRQCRECRNHFTREAEAIARITSPGEAQMIGA